MLEENEDMNARGIVFYAYAFPSFKAGVGVLAGKLPDSLGAIALDDESSRIVPYMDVWWTF